MFARRLTARLSLLALLGAPAACGGDSPATSPAKGGAGGAAPAGAGAGGGAGGGGAAAGGGASSSTSASGHGGAGGAGHAGAGGAGSCAPGRSTVDRPDDAAGHQVRANYVLPSDGVDEELDTNGKITTSIAAIQAWLGGQTGGRTLRIDSCGGAVDVRFVALSRTEADLRAEGVFIRDAIEEAMSQAGLLDPEKIEAVYYGGDADSTCGGGAWPPALIGRVAAMYLKGTFADPNIPPCGSNPVGASPVAPGYIDFGVLHEVMHTMGFVAPCAPHQILAGHASDGNADLMYAGNQPWMPSVLDVGRDDYFEHGIAGCPDLAKSVFLDPLPPSPELPPGW